MSVSIDIYPLSDSIDMYGDPDVSSAYSLSGHVSISVSSPSSFFDRRRTTARFLLSSLSLTFEGQSELTSPEGGYSPLRLCSYTRELVSHEPVELSNEGHEDSDEPCTWNVIFDIPLAGWLPASSLFGDASPDEGGTRYALYATAKLANLADESNSKSWSLSTLCAPFRSKAKLVQAPKCPITLNRFTDASDIASTSTSPFPTRTYSVQILPEENPSSDTIPSDVLGKLQVLADVPTCVDVSAKEFPISIRLRTLDLEQADCERLRIEGFTLDVEQVENYRFSPPREITSQYPIPPWTSQPPNKPLLSPHSLKTLCDMDFVAAFRPPNLKRTFSVMPRDQSGEYKLSGDGYIFASDASEENTSPTWYTMSTGVPFIQRRTDVRKDWAGSAKLRPNYRSPHLVVSHKLHVAIKCAYDIPGSADPIYQTVRYTVPLNFVEMAPLVSPISSIQCAASPAASAEDVVMGMPPSLPYAPSLPAYSQLFDSNGDRKIDYSVPLPLYTPRSEPASSSSSLALHGEPPRKSDVAATVPTHSISAA